MTPSLFYIETIRTMERHLFAGYYQPSSEDERKAFERRQNAMRMEAYTIKRELREAKKKCQP